jgi:hypothetical protein
MVREMKVREKVGMRLTLKSMNTSTLSRKRSHATSRPDHRLTARAFLSSCTHNSCFLARANGRKIVARAATRCISGTVRTPIKADCWEARRVLERLLFLVIYPLGKARLIGCRIQSLNPNTKRRFRQQKSFNRKVVAGWIHPRLSTSQNVGGTDALSNRHVQCLEEKAKYPGLGT